MKTLLTERWNPLKFHPIQNQYWNSHSRFNVVPAGRRSGKTELAKRKLSLKTILAFNELNFPPPYKFFAGAPTTAQAKRIYWNDLKRLIPPYMIKDKSESYLRLELFNQAELWVLGLDKPERAEGSYWDGCILDEYGNMKEKTFNEHIRPTLSERKGWCDFIGVPEGRNHYYKTNQKALQKKSEGNQQWNSFTWFSADILSPEEIEAAKEDLDELTFKQEYEAAFISFSGKCYYSFSDLNKSKTLAYDPLNEISVSFDFNISPGIAVFLQEQKLPNGIYGTAILGCIYVPQNSNTVIVTNRACDVLSEHKSIISIYGDATGGSQGTAKLLGSDWNLIEKVLYDRFNPNRIIFDVPRSNPLERDRINAVNSRCKSISGKVKLMVLDDGSCNEIIDDFEGVALKDDGSGEIDKKKDPKLSHLTDAIGYYIERKFPVKVRDAEIDEV